MFTSQTVKTGSSSECSDTDRSSARPDQEEEMKLRILAQHAMNEKLNEKMKEHKDTKHAAASKQSALDLVLLTKVQRFKTELYIV